MLVANDDGHVKNLSFFAGPDGARLAPHDDLLATGVCATPAFADDDATGPALPMTIARPGPAEARLLRVLERLTR